ARRPTSRPGAGALSGPVVRRAARRHGRHRLQGRARYNGDLYVPDPAVIMLLTSTGGASFTVSIPSLAALGTFMADIAAALEPGDPVTLSGDLGAGKTTFARALIRYLAADDTVEVPSLTFTFIQAYDLPRFTLAHADLYRLSGAAELAELGFDDLPEGAVV